MSDRTRRRSRAPGSRNAAAIPDPATGDVGGGIAGDLAAAPAGPAPAPAPSAPPLAPPRWSIESVTGGSSAIPLLTLFGLNLVDEFDRIAFAALTPEIRDAFDLADNEIVAIGAVSAVFILLAALPVGYLADRLPRVRVAWVAALAWGTMGILTGVAWALPVLFVARLFSGVARTSNEVVHPSLLADYYPPRVQPRVFQVHRLASPLSAIAGLLAGGIGAALGWRWAFVLLALPTFALLAGLKRLREPRRGESVDIRLAVATAAAGHVPFREARRRLFAVRSLKRLWLGGFLLGTAFITISQLLSLFFEKEYGFGPIGRGTVQFVYGCGIVTGIAAWGVVGSRATNRGDFATLARLTGLAFVQFAVGLVLMVLSPWPALSVALVFVFAVGFGGYQPVYYPLVARIAPAAVRSQAYAYALLFVGIGALFSIPLASLGESRGYRPALAILAGIVGLAGLVATSAARYVPTDVARADALLATTGDGATESDGEPGAPSA